MGATKQRFRAMMRAMTIYRSLVPPLRIGSQLITRKGIVFTIREAVVLVAENGGESLTVVVERVRAGQSAELLMTLGALANMTRGATFRRGRGTLIDWTRAERRRHADSGKMLVYRPLAHRCRELGFNE